MHYHRMEDTMSRVTVLAFCVLLTGLRVSELQAESLKINFCRPQVIRYNSSDALRVADTSIWQEHGNPAIPYREVIIALQSGVDSTGITYSISPVQEIHEALRLKICSGVIRIHNQVTSETYIPEYYKEPAWYPEKWVEYKGIQRKRRINCAVYIVYPVRYNPLEQAVQYITDSKIVKCRTEPRKFAFKSDKFYNYALILKNDRQGI